MVWPDAEIKSSPNSSKRCPKSSHASLNIENWWFQISLKDFIHLGYFSWKFVTKNFW